MEIKDSKAWDILTEREQSAISLVLGFNKSTWQAGEIMQASHYKFLEIRDRAEFLLKLFSDYFDRFGSLFREDAPVRTIFKLYIQLTLLERKKINEAIDLLPTQDYWISTHRCKLMEEDLNNLAKSANPHDQAVHTLILEFDRWNSFRVLPKALQEPSAYKRRNKNQHKKLIRSLTELPPATLDMFIKEFEYTGQRHKYYIPLFSSNFIGNYRVLLTKKEDRVLDLMTTAGVFVFDDPDLCQEFGILLADYHYSEKSSKKGLRFWPKFRQYLGKAVNGEALQGIRRDPQLFYRNLGEVMG